MGFGQPRNLAAIPGHLTGMGTVQRLAALASLALVSACASGGAGSTPAPERSTPATARHTPTTTPTHYPDATTHTRAADDHRRRHRPAPPVDLARCRQSLAAAAPRLLPRPGTGAPPAGHHRLPSTEQGRAAPQPRRVPRHLRRPAPGRTGDQRVARPGRRLRERRAPRSHRSARRVVCRRRSLCVAPTRRGSAVRSAAACSSATVGRWCRRWCWLVSGRPSTPSTRGGPRDAASVAMSARTAAETASLAAYVPTLQAFRS